MSLTLNMRALTDPWFSDFLLRVGNGDEETVDGNYIRIPDDMVIPFTNEDKSKDALIDAVFPSLGTNRGSSDDIISRAILSTKNENIDAINEKLIDRFSGAEKIYYSFDKAEEETNNYYPMEFLNSLTVSGLPPSCSPAQSWVPDYTFMQYRSLKWIKQWDEIDMQIFRDKHDRCRDSSRPTRWKESLRA